MPPIREPERRGTAVAVDADQLLSRAGSWQTVAGMSRQAAARLDGLVDGADGLPAEVVTRARATLSAAAGTLRKVSVTLFDVASDATSRSVVAREADNPAGAMLALDFAPVVRFTKDEKYFMENPRLWSKNATFVQAKRVVYPRTGQIYVIPAHYDADNDETTRAGNNDRAKLLYQWDPGSKTITYHLFYAYNNGYLSQNHEGDWERVTVKLDDDYRPEKVLYSAHKHANERDWKDVETNEDGRPIVYSSEGSHANAPHPGRWRTEVPGFLDHAGGGDRPVDLADKDVVDVTTEPYFGEDVKWGEIGDWDDTTGPDGPGPKKGPLTDGEYQKPVPRPRPVTPPLH